MRNTILFQLLAGCAIMRMADAGEPLSIMEFDTNLAEVEKPPELPAGAYTGECQEVTIQTSGKGNQYFAIKFVVPPSEIPPDIAEHYDEGAVLFWNRQVVPTGKDRRALFNLRKLHEAMGLDTNASSVDPNDWMGCKVKLRVQQTKYQGEMRAEVKSLEPAEATKPVAAAGRGKRK